MSTLLSTKKILLVDDDVIARLILKQLLLSLLPVKLKEASNGEIAIQLAHQTRYDAILMDIRLPGISGVEAARVIQTDKTSLSFQTPLIAVTAQTTPYLLDSYAAASMNRMLFKPISRRQLMRLVNQLGWLINTD